MKSNNSDSTSENNILDINMKDKLIFTDKVNVTKARYIYNLTFQEFKATFWNKEELNENSDKWDLKVYYNQVRKFCVDVIRNKVLDENYSLIKRKYKYADQSHSGRIYVIGFGIQSLQHNLRAFLTGDYLLDIDIKNCHPNILYQLVQEYNEKNESKLSTMFLENYVKNRAEVLKNNSFDKMSFLICLNCDEIQTNKKSKGFFTKNPFLIGFHKEKMIMFNTLIKDETTDNKKNPISSVMNKLFCVEENRLIQSVIKSNIGVPMFDGFMFDKDEKEKYDYLLEEDGIIQWDYKENLFDYDISDFDEEQSKDYDSMKLKFEKEHCLILTEPLVYLKKLLNEENKIEDSYYTEKTMGTLCQPLRILDENGKEQPFFNEWLKDEKRRTYNKFAFNPYVDIESDITPKHIYNTFNEFDVTKLEECEEPKWFLEFIHDNLANEHEESYEYLLNYCADFFQNPFKNCEIALVLRGEGGIGKDRFIELLTLMVLIQN